MPTDYFPANFNRVWIRGRFIDLGKAARGERKIGYYGSSVVFTPAAKTLIDHDTNQIMVVPSFSANPDIVDGYWAVLVPATDDPDVDPAGWTYFVQEPTGRHYNIEVPYDTPVISDVSDPLDGQRVIDLSDVSPTGGPSGGTIQLLQGRGISSMQIVAGDLIVTYSDEVEENLGGLPVWAINQASDYDGVPAPTDGQVLNFNATSSKWEPVTLSTVASFDASAISSGTIAYARLPVGTGSGTVAPGDDSRLSDARTPLPHMHSGADLTTGTVSVSRLPTGNTGSTVSLGNHTHSAADITSGSIPFAQLPTGTGSTQVSIGNHTHDGSAITAGTVGFARLPTGTTSSTVSIGNHTHLVAGGSQVALTDGATIATDASLGTFFTVSIAGNRTLSVPSNPTGGQICTWAVTASSADRTLTLASGTGGFTPGAVLHAAQLIRSGTTQVFRAIYDASATTWRLIEATPRPVFGGEWYVATTDSSQSPVSTVDTSVKFPTNVWTSGTSWISPNGTFDTFTLQMAGKWRVDGSIRWAGGAGSSDRLVGIAGSDGNRYGQTDEYPNASAAVTQHANGLINVGAAGFTVKINAWHNAGTANTTTIALERNADNTNRVSFQWMGP